MFPQPVSLLEHLALMNTGTGDDSSPVGSSKIVVLLFQCLMRVHCCSRGVHASLTAKGLSQQTCLVGHSRERRREGQRWPGQTSSQPQLEDSRKEGETMRVKREGKVKHEHHKQGRSDDQSLAGNALACLVQVLHLRI
jgi:hypothetical protein